MSVAYRAGSGTGAHCVVCLDRGHTKESPWLPVPIPPLPAPSPRQHTSVPTAESTGATIVSGGAASNKQVVDVLNDLLENARDGEYGFKTCADQVETGRAKELFASRAEGCRVAGEELIQLIRQYGASQRLAAPCRARCTAAGSRSRCRGRRQRAVHAGVVRAW